MKPDDARLAHSAATALTHPLADHPALSPRSLFSEILDWMVAPLILVWPMSIVVTYVVTASIANTPFDQALEARTIALGQQIQFQSDPPRLTLPGSARRLLRTDAKSRAYFQLRAADNAVLDGDADLPPPPEAEPASVGLVQFRNLQLRGENVRVAYLEVASAEGQHAIVQVAETLGGRAALANEIIRGVILPQFVMLPIAVVLVWFGLARGVRSLSILQARIHARAPDDMRPVDARMAPSEVQPLIVAFNQLLTRLDLNTREQKRFIADAAHQMRTPLAGLRTQAELALREEDTLELRRGLEQLVKSTVRTTRLVNQLLSLARAESGQETRAAHHLLDLNPLVREVVEERVPAALARSLVLAFEPTEHQALVRGDSVLLKEMTKNLLDNAIRYTPEGGAVTVRILVDPAARTVVLEVLDDGPGIPCAERELIFERFYRVLGNATDGSGLGLAIVREIASQHQARIALHEAHPEAPAGRRGASFSVHLRDQSVAVSDTDKRSSV